MSELNATETQPATPQIELPQPASSPLADCTPEQRLESQYLEAVNALVDPQGDGSKLCILADVLTWTLARIAVANGSQWVAGDVIRKFGDYTCKLDERRRAAAEAEKAQREGHKPH